MSLCEMCGKENRLYVTKVEGSELKLCNPCSSYGQVIKTNNFSSVVRNKFLRLRSSSNSKEEIVFVLVEDYSKKLQQSRNKVGLNQEDFAKKLNEKLSVVQKWESGQLKPRIVVARKLEKLLNVQLVVKQEVDDSVEGSNIFKKDSSDGFTLGDFIKVRKRK